MDNRALRRGNAFLALVHAAQAVVILALSTDFSLPVTRSSDNGFQKRYEVDVQTGTHTSISFTDLAETDVAPVQDLTSVDVLYRSDRPVGVIWPDGTPIQIPVALTHGFWISGLMVGLLGCLGTILLLWGIRRAVRGPRTPPSRHHAGLV